MPNPYARDVSHINTLDPYRLQELYKMHPCAEHVVKKLLVAGEREGGKDLDHDISDCIRTLKRWQEMRREDVSTPESPTTRYNWSVVPQKFRFIATDSDGAIYMYECEPELGSRCWHAPGIGKTTAHPSDTRERVDTPLWRNSMERRP